MTLHKDKTSMILNREMKLYWTIGCYINISYIAAIGIGVGVNKLPIIKKAQFMGVYTYEEIYIL